MNRIKIVGETLLGVGALESVKLGAASKDVSMTDADRQTLLRRLTERDHTATYVVIVLTVMHAALFALGMWLAYYYRDNVKAMTLVFGGSILSLLTITRSLRGVWREKCAIDMLAVILPSVSPQEAMKVLIAIYTSADQLGSGFSGGHARKRGSKPEE